MKKLITHTLLACTTLAMVSGIYVGGAPCQAKRLARPAENTASTDGSSATNSDTLKLSGGASFDAPPPSESTLLGSWKAHVLVVERHPTVTITTCTESQVSGTYIGQFGRFPLTGTYDSQSGKVNLSVDFTGLKLLRLRGMKSATAVLTGTIHGTTIKGTATFPEFHDKTFSWEAEQAPQ